MSEIKFDPQQLGMEAGGLRGPNRETDVELIRFHSKVLEHKSLLEGFLNTLDEANSLPTTGDQLFDISVIREITTSRQALLDAYNSGETGTYSPEIRIRIEQIRRIHSEIADEMAKATIVNEPILSLIRTELIAVENITFDVEHILEHQRLSADSDLQTLAERSEITVIPQSTLCSPKMFAKLFEGSVIRHDRGELLKKLYYSSSLRDYTRQKIPNFEDELTCDILTALAVCSVAPIDRGYIQRKLQQNRHRKGLRRSSLELNNTESQWESAFAKIAAKHRVTIDDIVDRLRDLLPPSCRRYEFHKWGPVTLARHIYGALQSVYPKSLKTDLKESLDPETRQLLSDILGADLAQEKQNELATEIPSNLLGLRVARISSGNRSVVIPFPLSNIPAVSPIGTIQDLLIDGSINPEDYLAHARRIRKINTTLLAKYGLTLIEDIFTPKEISEIEKISEVTIDSLSDLERQELAEEITRVILSTCDLTFQDDLPPEIKATVNERRRMMSNLSTATTPRDETLRRLLIAILTEPSPHRQKKGHPKRHRNRFFERIKPFLDFRFYQTPEDINDLYQLYKIFQYLNVRCVADRINRWKPLVTRNAEAFTEWGRFYLEVLTSTGYMLPSSCDDFEFIENVLWQIRREAEGHRKGQGKPSWLQLVSLIEVFDRIPGKIEQALAEHGIRFEIIDNGQQSLPEGDPISVDQNLKRDWIADLGEDE